MALSSLAKSPALIGVLAGGDDRADVARLVRGRILARLPGSLAALWIFGAVQAIDRQRVHRVGVEPERPHQAGGGDLGKHLAVAFVTLVVFDANRFAVRRTAAEFFSRAAQLEPGRSKVQSTTCPLAPSLTASGIAAGGPALICSGVRWPGSRQITAFAR